MRNTHHVHGIKLSRSALVIHRLAVNLLLTVLRKAKGNLLLLMCLLQSLQQHNHPCLDVLLLFLRLGFEFLVSGFLLEKFFIRKIELVLHAGDVRLQLLYLGRPACLSLAHGFSMLQSLSVETFGERCNFSLEDTGFSSLFVPVLLQLLDLVHQSSVLVLQISKRFACTVVLHVALITLLANGFSLILQALHILQCALPVSLGINCCFVCLLEFLLQLRDLGPQSIDCVARSPLLLLQLAPHFC
mmetsp:Transcript_8155/g.19470  ORF Transcript_8155/g.19470 Transcript_8155/m.19470 type:complete len:244 (-) Transcript_8155:1242-1973(-)